MNNDLLKKQQKNMIQTQRKPKYACVLRITLKKNNLFINLTNLKGETIIKFTSGLLQKKKSAARRKKQLRSILKFALEKVGYFIRSNFGYVKVITKGYSINSFSYFKQLVHKRKKLKIISILSQIPIVHNGCRPPKKRRV